jgi:hypothetical protein
VVQGESILGVGARRISQELALHGGEIGAAGTRR